VRKRQKAKDGRVRLLRDYAEHLRGLDRASSTVSAYGKGARKFLRFLQSTRVRLDAVDEDALEAYQRKLLRSRLARSTVDIYLRQVRAFLKFMVRTHTLVANPADAVPLPRMPRRLPRDVMTEAEAARLLTAPVTTTDKGVLHRAVLEVFYSSAIGIGELCRLKLDDVDTGRGVVRVWKGKGAKDRVAVMGNSACMWVRLYRETVRPRRAAEGEQHLFVGHNTGRMLNRQIVQRFVRKHARQTGTF
jgi:integrase/recombinase XerD